MQKLTCSMGYRIQRGSCLSCFFSEASSFCWTAGGAENEAGFFVAFVQRHCSCQDAMLGEVILVGISNILHFSFIHIKRKKISSTSPSVCVLALMWGRIMVINEMPSLKLKIMKRNFPPPLHNKGKSSFLLQQTAVSLTTNLFLCVTFFKEYDDTEISYSKDDEINKGRGAIT